MSSSNIVQIIVAIVTAFLVLASLVGAVWGFFFVHIPMLGVVCLVLAALFSVFSHNDFKKYFGKSDAPKSK